MSTRVRVDLRCDHPGCHEGLTFERDNRGGLNISQAKMYAEFQGWNAKGKRQLCPDHKAEPKR